MAWRWSEFKRNRSYIYLNTEDGLLGGFAIRDRGQSGWTAIGPTTQLSSGGRPDSFLHHSPVYGRELTLEEAKTEVESRISSKNYEGIGEVTVDIIHY